MPVGRRESLKDPALRLSGVMLLIGGVMAFLHLSRMVHLPPHHDPTLREFGVAAVAYVGTISGGILLIHGLHIFDEIEMPRRSRLDYGLDQSTGYSVMPSEAVRPKAQIDRLRLDRHGLVREGAL